MAIQEVAIERIVRVVTQVDTETPGYDADKFKHQLVEAHGRALGSYGHVMRRWLNGRLEVDHFYVEEEQHGDD